MVGSQWVRRGWAAVRRHPIEVGMQVVLWAGFILLMANGESNGVGYFQQPGHSLLFPLLHGAVWNAVTFLAAGLVLLPQLLARRWRAAASSLAAGTVLVLCGKTLGEWLYIQWAVPDLRAVSPFALGLENVYSFAAALLLGLLYFLARRGLTRGGFARDGSITVRSGTTRHRLQLDAVRYLKAEGNYVAFHTETEHRPLWVLTTMAAALEQLPADRFVRIHRSFAVNLARVSGLAGGEVLVDGDRLPIGRKYVGDARSRVNAWLDRETFRRKREAR
jgi:LytTr DNA-binding domain